MDNPFAPAAPGFVKVLLYGPPGSGKTLAALSFPGVAVIDSEAGSGIYAARPGVAPFSVMRASSLEDILRAITYVREDRGRSFQTLVIDSVTPAYKTMLEDALKSSTKKEISYRERAKIRIRFSELFRAFANLPVHLVVTAHETDHYNTGSAGELKADGVMPFIHEDIGYAIDYSLRMLPDHSAVVEKGRNMRLGRVQKVDFNLFMPAVAQESKP